MIIPHNSVAAVISSLKWESQVQSSREFGRYAYDAGERTLAAKLGACGAYLWLRDYFTTGTRPKLVGGIFCKQALACGFCASLRATASVRRNLPKVQAVLDDSPGLVLHMLTLTSKNQPSLKDTHQDIDAAYRRMLQKRTNSGRGRHPENVWGHIIGGMGSYEFKRGKESGQWHPHLHLLVALLPGVAEKIFYQEHRDGRRVVNATERREAKRNGERLYAHGELPDAWSDLLGYQANLDLVPIRLYGDGDDDQSPERKALMEVFKYPFKFASLDAPDRLDAWRYCKGKRLLRSFGIFHGVKDSERFAEDLSAFEGLPFEDIYLRYVSGRYVHDQIFSKEAIPWMV